MDGDLRDYQVDDLLAVRTAFREGHKSVLLQGATGSGKGHMTGHLVKRIVSQTKRVLFTVHGRPLVFDMSKRLTDLGLEHGIIMASTEAGNVRPWLPIQVASLDTLVRRQHFPKAHMLIVDECRFVGSPTWRKVIDGYKAAGSYILGLDATPIRPDGEGLGSDMFDVMVCGPQPQWLIQRGYLVPSKMYSFDLPSGAETMKEGKAGEPLTKELSRVFDKPTVVGDAVKMWKLLGNGEKTISFCVDCHHADQVAEKYRCAGVDWAMVSEETPDDEREVLWKRLDDPNDSLRGLSHVGVIGYGFNHPIIACIQFLKKTNSQSNWLQGLGRGTRPYLRKTHMIVLDHGGNMHLHGIYEDAREWSLKDGVRRTDGKKRPPVVCKCKACSGDFYYGPKACPYCKAPYQVTIAVIKQIEHDLHEMDRKPISVEDWRTRFPADEQRMEQFIRFCHQAKKNNYSIKWAFAKQFGMFREKVKPQWIAEAKRRGVFPSSSKPHVRPQNLFTEESA